MCVSFDYRRPGSTKTKFANTFRLSTGRRLCRVLRSFAGPAPLRKVNGSYFYTTRPWGGYKPAWPRRRECAALCIIIRGQGNPERTRSEREGKKMGGGVFTKHNGCSAHRLGIRGKAPEHRVWEPSSAARRRDKSVRCVFLVGAGSGLNMGRGGRK